MMMGELPGRAALGAALADGAGLDVEIRRKNAKLDVPTPGNLEAKASGESASPSNADLLTSPGASRQVPADQAQARPVLPEASTTTGRSSTSNNSSFMESPLLGDPATDNAGAVKSQVSAPFDLGDVHTP